MVKFLFNSYRKHWLASPAGALAALVSTIGAASIMHYLAPLYSISLVKYFALTRSNLIFVNAILGPLLAYLIYLSTYYTCMFFKERKQLLRADGSIDSEKFKEWIRVAKYDYVAHLPSDCYLIPLAAIVQIGLETGGLSIFWAIIASQSADDIITFLKEPALWSGAKELVSWEKRNNTTLSRHIINITRRGKSDLL